MSIESINLEHNNSGPNFQLSYISVSKYENDWKSILNTHPISE